jgi:hypothetical protein
MYSRVYKISLRLLLVSSFLVGSIVCTTTQESLATSTSLYIATTEQKTSAYIIAAMLNHLDEKAIINLIKEAAQAHDYHRAHGAARLLIQRDPLILDRIKKKSFESTVEDVLRKQYFLITHESSVLKKESGETLTLRFKEVVISKPLMVINKRLSLANLFLHDIDGIELFIHPAVEELDISHNALTTIPPTLGLFSHLKVLRLNNNFLTSLPSQLGDLHSLIRLDLQHNALGTLPSSYENLTNLWRLDISHNKFSTLPEVIIKLARLSWLFAQGNTITTTPENKVVLKKFSKCVLT